MKKQKTKDNFWFVLGLTNILGIAYPLSTYLRTDSLEDQVFSVFVLVGAGLVLAIVDTISIVVAYSQ
jgi:hypothetical protein